MAGDDICVGVIAGAHGVRGAVRIKAFTAEPRNVAAYGPVSDESGARRFRLELQSGTGSAKGGQVPAERENLATSSCSNGIPRSSEASVKPSARTCR